MLTNLDRYLVSRIVLGLVLITGCQGEVPTPKTTTSSSELSPETNKSTAKPTTELASAGSAIAVPVPAEPPFELESDFKLLTLDQFDAFGAEPETWKETAGEIVCTGKPKGYLYTKQSHQNFTLRLEYRFPRPASLKDESKFKGNTGFLVYITGEHKLWPVCLEVQGKHIQMAAIKENGGAQPVVVEDNESARQSVRRPVGEWNSIEIVSKNGELSASLNGTLISKSQPNFLSEGAIGIQAEDHPFAVRRMRIRTE